MKSIIDEANKESKYVGSFPNMPAQAILSLAPPNDYESTPSINLFLATYQAVPCVLLSLASNGYERLHATTIVDYLRDELNHDLENDHIMTTYNHKNDDLSVISRCCDLGNGVMIDMGSIHLNSNVSNPNKLKPDEFDNSFLITSRFCIYFLPGKRKYVQDLAQKITKMTVTEIEPLKSFTLHMVCKNINGYYLSCITIKKPLITDLGLHYGQKFVSIHNKIIEALNKKEEKGIVFLHGIPGSGKTHYIRYLIHEIEDKTLIYIPPDMAKEISAPDFLPFLMQYPNSILIIEDAENIIKDRSESSIPSQAVANLLNLSDGLLGDAMHQQIIATFNCDLTKIDPALLRQGRLIANYEFNKLDLESSKILSDKLGFGTDNIKEPMTLAQIYNQSEKNTQITLDEK